MNLPSATMGIAPGNGGVMGFVIEDKMRGWQSQCAHAQRESLEATLRDSQVFGIEVIGAVCEAMDECSGRMECTIAGKEYLGHVFDVDKGKVALLVRLDPASRVVNPPRVQLFKRGNVLGESLRALVAEIDRRVNAVGTCQAT